MTMADECATDNNTPPAPPPDPDTIRLCVEPVEVELESADGSLLFSALQSAFPCSTAIYFRPQGAECRTMVKFDGRRFLPPNGGWARGTDYFVELSGPRHPPFPFGSYEQASKQFERSVNLVQKMMNGAGGGGTTKVGVNGQEGGGRESEQEQQQPEMNTPGSGDRTEGDEERENSRKGNDSAVVPARVGTRLSICSVADSRVADRDFADLARICAGKDAIIDGLRAELDEIRAREAERAESEAEWRERGQAAEQELHMLRELARDQQGMHGRIKELESQLDQTSRMAEARLMELEIKLTKSQREANDWKEKHELSVWTVKELNGELKKTQRERAELMRKKAVLEEQVNGEAMEFGKRFQERERVQQELLADNTRLYQIKEQLELQCRALTEQAESAKAEAESWIKEREAEFEAKEAQLRELVGTNERKMEEMVGQIGQLRDERAKMLEELRRISTHSHQGDGEPIFSCYQD